VAGVGNIYADEALWQAQIHPERSADSLTRPELDRLTQAIQDVLRLGIERRGTSISTYVDAEGSYGENQAFLKAYGRGPARGRAAQACERCGTPMALLLLGQRSSHYCPRCQRAPRRG
jgi:formamidopyrimidine-DNA glycosylase